jgi:alpha-L-fucosidase
MLYKNKQTNKLTTMSEIGLFVHLGLYSIVQYKFITPTQRKKNKGGNGSEWLQHILSVNEGDWRPPAGWKETQEYFHQHFPNMKYENLDFTTTSFSTEHIIRIAKKIQATYLVFTTKHHDGYCMFPTTSNSLSSNNIDFVGQIATACRENGLLFGAYYSWPSFEHKCKVQYMKTEVTQHIHEIQSHYKPDIWWFDGHWEIKTKQAQTIVNQLIDYIKQENPHVQINDRIGLEYKERKTDIHWLGNATFRNFEDRYLPSEPPSVSWEYIDTIGYSWGRNSAQIEQDYKNGCQLKTIYDQVHSLGGKFMINIGPNPDGTLDEWEEKSLEEFSLVKK